MDAKIKGISFFVIILLLLTVWYVGAKTDLTENSLSSDVWGYQMLESQKEFGYWDDVPVSYNQSELYIVFPLFYQLNPSFERGLFSYHVLTLVVIFLAYIMSGLVIYTLFRNWYISSLAGLLVVFPRYMFPTKIGIFSIGALRGNVLYTPFYLLLSYYWILHGIKSEKKNIALAILAGLLVYVYPPTALLWPVLSVLAALIVHRKRYLKRVVLFCIVFFAIATPFLTNHFANPDTGMLDQNTTLTVEDKALQVEILQEAFTGNGFIASVEFEEMKRIVWDQGPFVLLFAISLFIVWRYRHTIDSKYIKITTISSVIIVLLWAMVFSVELINWYVMSRGNPPIFIEHLRQLRGVGFALYVQALLLLVLVLSRKKVWMSVLAIIISIAILFGTIGFAKHTIRSVVRVVVPESVRLKYNLAPIILPEEVKDYGNLVAVSIWARENLPGDTTKFFVFDDYQAEFKFKVLSRHDTNLTQKEGSVWATSGFENSKRWYEERVRYEKAEDASDFRTTILVARTFGATHMLLPRGQHGDAYDTMGAHFPVVYENKDYRVLEL